MTVFVFGNPDLPADSLPLRILPALKKRCPGVIFKVQDPNEEWEVPEELIVIDTVLGVDEVKVFDDLEDFANTPRVSLHDFDAVTNLRYLRKLGKVRKIKIIGLPPTISEKEALDSIAPILIAT
jgi:Ni,Fe-hydrogenase maturation factor